MLINHFDAVADSEDESEDEPLIGGKRKGKEGKGTGKDKAKAKKQPLQSGDTASGCAVEI